MYQVPPRLSITRTLLFMVVTLALCYFILFTWKRRRLYYCSLKLPGPFGLPLLGSAHMMRGGPADGYNVLVRVAQYAPVTRAWFGPFLFVVITRPEDMDILLSRYLDKSMFYGKYLTDTIRTALPSSPVSIWKERRRAINHTFNSATITSFVPIFVKHATRLADTTLTNMCGEKNIPQDLFPKIWKHALQASCEALGDVCPDLLETTDKYIAAAFRFEEILRRRFFRPHLNLDFFWKESSLRKEQLETGQIFEDFVQQVIDTKKTRFRNDDTFLKDRRFLNYLLDLNSDGKIKREGVLDESAFMFHAASETSSVTISTVLVMLGLHPHIQEKVYHEVSKFTTVTIDEINQMDYLERVIKETLRIFPSVPFLLRKVDKEIKLDSYFIPAGCEILIPLPHLHRRPDLWPDPLKFDPDRFLPQEIEKRHRCAFIPFSVGPRNCPGSKYAMLSLKIFLATALRRFRVVKCVDYKTVEDLDLEFYIIGKAKKGYRVVLEERQ
ncbi:cytochrome P450 4C1-like [Zophobas morio]|uniref:cytochrome P450 4C1-like n=1 Tax=Zophobas morio TaxID=2755281 RepID=UPI0030829CDC